MTRPVYLFSSERSGTNLLRKRLSEVQDTVCCTIPPIHFLRTFGYWSHTMGSFTEDEKWENVVGLFIRSTIERAVPWDVSFDKEHIIRSYELAYGDRRSLVLLAHHFYQLYAKKKGFQSYFCKDLWLFDFAQEIINEIPDAYFIHLVRDPRDVCVSQKARPFGMQSVLEIAKDWKWQCDTSMRALQTERLASRGLSIKYEKLIQNETEVLDLVVSQFSLEEINHKSSLDTKIDTHFHEWSNLSKPTLKENMNKFHTSLTKREVRVIENVCWNTMITLGYKSVSELRPDLTWFDVHVSPIFARFKQFMRNKRNRFRLRNEKINRRASETLVKDLERLYR